MRTLVAKPECAASDALLIIRYMFVTVRMGLMSPVDNTNSLIASDFLLPLVIGDLLSPVNACPGTFFGLLIQACACTIRDYAADNRGNRG